MYLQVKKGKDRLSRLSGVNLDIRALENGPITHRAVYSDVTSFQKNNSNFFDKLITKVN